MGRWWGALARSRTTAEPPLQRAAGAAARDNHTARAFGEATKKCGDGCTGEKLRQQLEKTSVEMKGLVPTFAYRGSDHYPYANWLLQQVQGTVYKKIDSFEADASK